MNRKTPSPFFLVAVGAVITAACLTLMLVWFITAVRAHALELRETRNPDTITQVCDLPCQCRPFYGKGGDDWIDCMGVSYVTQARQVESEDTY